jgi:hypothetical protein
MRKYERIGTDSLLSIGAGTHVGVRRRERRTRVPGWARVFVVAVALVGFCATPALASYSGPNWTVGGLKLTVPKTIEWSNGSFAVENYYPVIGAIRLKCEASGKGTVSFEGKGEISKWSMAKCESTSGCENEQKVEALNLPWHTQLASVGGVIRNEFESGGTGSPAFKFSCKTLGFTMTSETTTVPGQIVKNLKGSVEEYFPNELINCSEGATDRCSLFGTFENPTVVGGGELQAK